MATAILTPANCARYLEWKRQHDHLERLCKSWHEAFKLELLECRSWSQEGYTAAIREYQRQHFQHKLLLVEYPDIHEQFLTMITVQALIMAGPQKLATEPAPAVPLMFEQKPKRKGYVQRLIEEHLPPTEEIAP